MRKNILLTGAFGNIGSFVVNELLAQGHHVTAFDKAGPITKSNAKKFTNTGITICWGDITNKQDLEVALQDIDTVIHLAGIFPPASENNTSLAKAVNIDGTHHLIEAMEKSSTAKRLIFASSIAVYGKKQGRIKPPLKASDPLSPDDYYGQTKLACEEMIQCSSLKWTMMRISACPPVNIKNMASFIGAPVFESHPDSRLEVIHPADTALAFTNAVACDESIGKILLLGGGEKNRLTCLQLFNIMLTTLGLKILPREAFQITEHIAFHGDWLDTAESQRLLKFQRYDTETIYRDFITSLGIGKQIVFLIKIFSPIISWFILRSSPYYKQQIAK